jgi:hypothetical protein
VSPKPPEPLRRNHADRPQPRFDPLRPCRNRKLRSPQPGLLRFPSALSSYYLLRIACRWSAQQNRPNGPAESSPGLRPKADALGKKHPRTSQRPERSREPLRTGSRIARIRQDSGGRLSSAKVGAGAKRSGGAWSSQPRKDSARYCLGVRKTMRLSPFPT